MPADEDFLRKLLDNPADDTARLVYADWLDEQGDETSRAKAEFLRGAASPAGLGKKQSQEWTLMQQRLQELAATLDTNWLAVVSTLEVENCSGKKEEHPATPGMRIGRTGFDVVCGKRWNELTPTKNRAVRFCEGCREKVHYCDTIVVARRHARAGHCIAVDLGIIRREQDLELRRTVVGKPSRDFMRRERERMQPDPVSEERERRKQEARDGG
ncbi:MAG: hypothetical protein JWO38_6723 [Gemmataceae bacterium]|nr:hypothetical protein [Gemmataceae bacterium]